MLKEFCAENCERLEQAMKQGIQRVELCDNLAVGGTTPSYGVIKQAVKLGRKYKVDISTMIRPRGGDFHYNKEEIEIMKEDIKQAKILGATGVVFGCLTEDKRIDKESMIELVSLADEIETTFHMAFDEIEKKNQIEEMGWLIEQGVTRILTHGGTDKTVVENSEWINELVRHADERIEILVGGGVSHVNLQEVSEAVDTNQYHGTKIVPLD
jgi:copper homeostasis protein